MKFPTPLFMMIGLCHTILIHSLTAQDTIIFENNLLQPNFIELYTSEGCSSCPPAEAWLSQLADDPGLWKSVIPIAFHVTYWDNLGWPDSFAKPAYTQRQQSYARQLGLSSVYTPGFFLNGAEWKGWLRGEKLPIPSHATAGILRAKIQNNTVTLSYHSDHKQLEPVKARVALLGFDLAIDIKRGENSGKKLQHNFVVLSLNDMILNSPDHTDYYSVTASLPKISTTSSRLALAAWIENDNSPIPLVALGGWLKN